MTNSNQRPLIFILSWNRPQYLWACLDALHLTVRGQADFVLLDNASSDPAIEPVIRAFERRGLFAEVVRGHRNDPQRVQSAINARRAQLPEFVGYIESDTVVPDTQPNWLAKMQAYLEANPRLGMLGSRVDPRDFIDPAEAQAQFGELSNSEIAFLTKAKAPMRNWSGPEAGLATPFNPPGRLLLFRSEALLEVGFTTDMQMDKNMKAAGWNTAIAAEVLHRHLSLANVYDYPEYSQSQRDAFFAAMRGTVSKL